MSTVLPPHGTPLQAGTRVYRVIEVDPCTYGPHTWEVATGIVERASVLQIKLARPFHGHTRKVFTPRAFGSFFFETPQQAIQHFLTERRTEIAPLKRKREEAERALTWAEGQVPA